MGRLSKNLVDQDFMIQIEGRLFNVLSKRESGELEGMLRGLLTSPELEMLAKRVSLLKMLSEGIRHQKIVDRLKMSTTTISQMKSRLRYDRNLQKLVKDLKEFS